MPRVELETKLPDDTLVRYSTAHPKAEFRMFASRSTANGLVVIVEAETAELEALLYTFEENPDIYIYSCEVFYTDQRSVLFQIEADEHPARTAARAAGIIPQYPMILRDGWLRRHENPFGGWPYRPDVVVADTQELADVLTA